MSKPRLSTGLLLVLTVAALAAGADGPAQVVSARLRNLAGQELSAVPVTFGQAFARGAVPAGQQPAIHGLDALWQVDVKRHYADGSARFAIFSMIAPKLAKEPPLPVAIVSETPAPTTAAIAPVRLADLLKADFDATVTLTFPDGVVRTASARKLLSIAGDKAEAWLAGPVCGEWIVSGAPTDAAGTADPDLRVQFAVRAYVGARLGQIGAVRVGVTVENCLDTWAGNIRYDASLSLGGKEVFAVKALDHRRLSRWRKAFWWSAEGPIDAPAVQVIHDVGYLCRSGLLPNYDLSIKVPPRQIDAWLQRWKKNCDDLMGNGMLTAYMPTTGGRPEIAPYPSWAVDYLYTQDPQLQTVVLGQGELAGAWPIHVRYHDTGRLATIIDKAPDFWLSGRVGTQPKWQPDRSAPEKQVKLTPDVAHEGSFAYIPYLLTGDYYYMEEALFWANFNSIDDWPKARQGGEGILRGQIRGRAWGLRNLADAVWAAPDGWPEQKLFEKLLLNNIALRHEVMDSPEYAAAHPLGGTDLGDIRGNTKEARIHDPNADPEWIIEIPWQGDYLCWAWHHIAMLGWLEADGCNNAWLKMRVGLISHADDYDPRMLCPYKLVTGHFVDGKQVYYDNWKTMGQQNARINKPAVGGDYTYSARAALVVGVETGYPGAAEALKWLDEHWATEAQTMERDRHWAVLPRTKARP